MKLLFTGGGTAGHVTPNLALMDAFKADGHHCIYVGSTTGIERELVHDVPFHAIASGKLRRYFSWQNFVDPVKIFWGFLQAILVCLRERPTVVFSKGGFVAVPVVMAAWVCRVPVICHESDVTPGLANRLCAPFARQLCVTFAETAALLPAAKVRVTGTPVRQSLLDGDARRVDPAWRRQDKALLLVFGGSLGAATINTVVRARLEVLLAEFDVIHITGAGNEAAELQLAGYTQRAFLGDNFGDVLAAADVVVSRAGANALYELLMLRKPHLLIPLPAAASRGDQLVNAKTFADRGLSKVIYEDQLDADDFVEAVRSLYAGRFDVIARLSEIPRIDSVAKIRDVIAQVVGQS